MAMKVFIATLAILILAGAVSAQDRSAPAQPNTVFTGGDGKYEANPDTAVIQFNISTQESTSQAAYDRASRAAEQVRSLLRGNGIEPKTAQFGYFSLQPVYDYKTAQRKLVGYRVNANVSVKLHDFAKIAPILEQLSNLDVTADQNLTYTLEDMEAAKARAVEDAYHKAHEAAAALARASGRTLGELSYASVDTSEPSPVRPLMAMSMARTAGAAPAPTAEFSPLQITVTAHVNALFTLK
jgi:uncharacterized protein